MRYATEVRNEMRCASHGEHVIELVSVIAGSVARQLQSSPQLTPQSTAKPLDELF
jgi:hypothetical protein